MYKTMEIHKHYKPATKHSLKASVVLLAVY